MKHTMKHAAFAAVLLLAGPALAETKAGPSWGPGADDAAFARMLAASFKDKGIAKTDRLTQDETQAFCSDPEAAASPAAAEKRQLAAAGAMAVEMEAAAVGAAALTRGVPFYCVRVVSDEAGEDLPLDFNRFRNPDGRLSRRRIAAAALKHPGRIPALIKLDRSANRASQALGEFLVNCQF